MRRIPISRLAFARSGDKGRNTNVGIVALDDAGYAVLVDQLTAARVAEHFAGLCDAVERYELPNLRALNFVLRGSLGDGASVSTRTDAQGKLHGIAALAIEVEVPDDLALHPEEDPWT